MLIKFLALIAVFVMIYFVFFKKPSTIQDKKRKKDTQNSDENIMVECKKCSVFVSNKEAIIKNGEFFCSRECAGM